MDDLIDSILDEVLDTGPVVNDAPVPVEPAPEVAVPEKPLELKLALKPPAARPAAKPAAKPASAKATSSSQRRGPGRPPSKAPPPPLEKKGIVDAPDNANNRIEFVHSAPAIFKTLFTLFKNQKARNIYLRASPTALTFFTWDRAHRLRVVANIAGEHVNWHYVESEIWLSFIRDDKNEHIFSVIDRTFFKITITQPSDETDRLYITYKDSDLSKDCTYTLRLCDLPRDEELFAAEAELQPDVLAGFPVEFTLTAKQFKKTISDIGSISKKLTFEKLGVHPLQFGYTLPTLTYCETYHEPEKIKLKSTVGEREAFYCTANISDLKSLAGSLVTDDVRVLLRNGGDLVFRSAIDAKALVVSTLVKPS